VDLQHPVVFLPEHSLFQNPIQSVRDGKQLPGGNGERHRPGKYTRNIHVYTYIFVNANNLKMCVHFSDFSLREIGTVVNLYKCICIYVYIHIRIYMYICMNMNIYIYIYIYMYIYVHACLYILICVCIYSFTYLLTHIYTYIELVGGTYVENKNPFIFDKEFYSEIYIKAPDSICKNSTEVTEKDNESVATSSVNVNADIALATLDIPSTQGYFSVFTSGTYMKPHHLNLYL
jgi:hypothetical protein